MTEEQHNPVVFYFDTTHGNLIPKLLKAVGLDVRRFAHLGLRRDADDREWIAECGKHDWVIISGDKDISRVPEERQAVIDAKCKVFMFEDSHRTRTEDWAASLLVARQKIIEVALRTNGPYFALIKPCRVGGHLRSPNFVAGGGWKPQQEWPTNISPSIEHPQPMRAARRKRERQATIDFPEHVALLAPANVPPHCDLCARLFGYHHPTGRV